MHPLWKSLAFFSKLERSMPYGTEISLLNIKPKKPPPHMYNKRHVQGYS